MKRGGRLRQIGPKAERQRDDLKAARDALRTRSRRECEADFSDDCTGWGTDPHHVWPSDRRRELHDPDRMLWVCRPCHDEIDARRFEAETAGLIARADW